MDIVVVTAGLILSLINDSSIYKYIALLKLARIYKINYLVKALFRNRLINLELEIYNKTRTLFSTIIIILPLIMKFVPLFLITCYVLGIIGMEAFYDTYDTPSTEQYGMYDEFSSFR